jgi:CubicO group peptidase (beta-lactamase class C family)
LPLTVEQVSFLLGVRQALDGGKRLTFSQALGLQFNSMRAMNGVFAEDAWVKQAYQEANVFDFDQSLADMITKLAELSLVRQPGAAWEYSMSTNVLGRIVEVASGMGLDQFVQERIAKPLNLTATGFSVSQSQAGNIAEPQVEPATGKRPAMIVDNLTNRPKLLSGDDGMVSTAEDYVRFCQMLLNGGENLIHYPDRLDFSWSGAHGTLFLGRSQGKVGEGGNDGGDSGGRRLRIQQIL